MRKEGKLKLREPNPLEYGDDKEEYLATLLVYLRSLSTEEQRAWFSRQRAQQVEEDSVF